MSSVAQAARAPRARSARSARRRTWLLSGGVLWIALFAVLLAGVVAINVAVLRLNLQLDEAGRERTDLKTDIARLRSEISSAAATNRIERLAQRRARARRGRARGHDLHPAGAVKTAATNRRIALLAAGFLVLLGAALARAAWIQVVKGPEYAAMALRQHRETVIVPAARGTIVDRNGEPLAIGRLATTVYANPRQVDDARDLTLAAAKQLDLDPAALYPTLVDRSRGFVYVARKADPRKAKNLEALDFAGPRLLPGGAPRTTRRGRSRRRFSDTRVSTTRASRGSSARSRERSPASPGARRS